MDEIKKLRVVPFKKEHLSLLKLRDFELHRLEHIQQFPEVYEHGAGYSVFDNSGLIFCAGVIPYWKGVGEAWILCDVRVKHYIRELYFYTELYLDKIIDRYKLWRVQSSVMADYYAGHRFLERMGFKKEGLMRKYDWQGKDYYLYARIK